VPILRFAYMQYITDIYMNVVLFVCAVIERDALAIFTKYLSLDCPCPVAISDDLRVVTVKRMCSHDDDGSINTQCFNECQQAVYKILENE